MNRAVSAAITTGIGVCFIFLIVNPLLPPMRWWWTVEVAADADADNYSKKTYKITVNRMDSDDDVVQQMKQP